jgi:hypothetical protein
MQSEDYQIYQSFTSKVNSIDWISRKIINAVRTEVASKRSNVPTADRGSQLGRCALPVSDKPVIQIQLGGCRLPQPQQHHRRRLWPLPFRFPFHVTSSRHQLPSSSSPTSSQTPLPLRRRSLRATRRSIRHTGTASHGDQLQTRRARGPQVRAGPQVPRGRSPATLPRNLPSPPPRSRPPIPSCAAQVSFDYDERCGPAPSTTCPSPTACLPIW